MTKDKRPRYGYCFDLDQDPQRVWEAKDKDATPVVIIPLAFHSAKQKAKINKFVKEFLAPLQ